MKMFKMAVRSCCSNTMISSCRRSISSGFVLRNEEWSYWHSRDVLEGAKGNKKATSHHHHFPEQVHGEQFGQVLPEKRLSPQHKHNVENKELFGPIIKSKGLDKKNKGKTQITDKTDIEAEGLISDRKFPTDNSELYWMSNIKTKPWTTKTDTEVVDPKINKEEIVPKTNKEVVEPFPLKPKQTKKTLLKDVTKISYKFKDNPVENPQRIHSESGFSGNLLQIPLDRENGLPSVTRILKATMSEHSKMVLARWEEKMIQKLGEDGFAVYKAKIFQRGHVLHKHVEDFMTTGQIVQHQNIEDEVSKSHLESISSVLESFTQPFALESAVIHPTLEYQGILDCLAKYNDTTVLIDWKTSERIKPTLASLFDNPLQVAAYIGAVNYDENYEPVGSISGGAVVVVYNTGYPSQVHRLQEGDLQKAWRAWLKRLALYKQMVMKGEI